MNLTRMRLLQQLFPMAHMVVVLRHPEAVAAAVAKWVSDPAPALIDHWLDAHDRLAADLPFVHAAAVIRYEDLVRDPVALQAGLAAFLDVTPPKRVAEAIADGNRDYNGQVAMSAAQAVRAVAWGYGPQGAVDSAWWPDLRHPLRAVREAAATAFAAGGLSGLRP